MSARMYGLTTFSLFVAKNPLFWTHRLRSATFSVHTSVRGAIGALPASVERQRKRAASRDMAVFMVVEDRRKLNHTASKKCWTISRRHSGIVCEQGTPEGSRGLGITGNGSGVDTLTGCGRQE